MMKHIALYSNLKNQLKDEKMQLKSTQNNTGAVNYYLWGGKNG